MEDIFEFAIRFGVFFIVIIVIFFLGLYINKLRRVVNMKYYPSCSEVKLIKQDIKNLKNQKSNYQFILDTIHKNHKVSKDTARGLIIEVENENIADTSQLKSLVKKNITFSYPCNWKVNNIDKSLDNELFFSVDGSYSATIGFALIGRLSEEIPLFSEVLMPIKSQFKGFKETSKIDHWGNFNGEGISFSALGITCPCKGFVFLYRDGINSMCINQVSSDDDIDNTSNGFRLIENTFKFIDNYV